VGSVLVKPVPSAIALMPMVAYELPYEVSKEMLLVDDVNNKEFLCSLFLSMYEELPAPKEKNYRKKNRKKAISYEFLPTANGSEQLAAQPPVNHSLILKPLDFFDISNYSNSIVAGGLGEQS